MRHRLSPSDPDPQTELVARSDNLCRHGPQLRTQFVLLRDSLRRPYVVEGIEMRTELASEIEASTPADGDAPSDVSPGQCGCGAKGEYTCGAYVLCEECSWLLAEAGGAP